MRVIATASAIAEALLDDIASFMREPENQNIRVDIEERLSRDLVRAAARRQRVGRRVLGQRRSSRASRIARTGTTGSRSPCYAGHPLAGAPSLGFEQTLDFDHVGLPPSTAVHTMLQRAAASAGRTVTYRVIVSSFDAAFRVVAANLGISVVPLEVAGARPASTSR